MALYIPRIFHLARLLYVRPKNLGPYLVALSLWWLDCWLAWISIPSSSIQTHPSSPLVQWEINTGWNVRLTTHYFIVPGLRMRGALLLSCLLTSWLYGPLIALASITTEAYSSLSTAFFRHLLIFVVSRAFSASSGHLILGLSILSHTSTCHWVLTLCSVIKT